MENTGELEYCSRINVDSQAVAADMEVVVEATVEELGEELVDME